jgi:hypothetical protein
LQQLPALLPLLLPATRLPSSMLHASFALARLLQRMLQNLQLLLLFLC